MLTDENSALRMQIQTYGAVIEALAKQRDAALLRVGTLRKALERVLDGCFCDDGRDLPECTRCVEVRTALEIVAEEPEERSPMQQPAKAVCFWCDVVSSVNNDVVFRSAYGVQLCDGCMSRHER